MQAYCVISAHGSGKFFSPMFAKRELNGTYYSFWIAQETSPDQTQPQKTPWRHDPVTTISDVAHQMVAKKYYCKLDRSQAYHMAIEQSIWPVALNFGSWIFACNWLEHSLSGQLSAFISVIKDILDPAVNADRCGQYVDDTGVAAHTVSELEENHAIPFNRSGKAQHFRSKMSVKRRNDWFFRPEDIISWSCLNR